MMFSRLATRQVRRFLLHPNSRTSFIAPDDVDIYVGADRSKLYSRLGIFCLIQGSAWLFFGRYLFSRRAGPLTYEMMKEDLNEFNRHLANRLESWVPDSVAEVILHRKRRQPAEVEVVEHAEEKSLIQTNDTEKEAESEMKRVADRMRGAFGVSTGAGDVDGGPDKESVRAKRIVPYLCLVMGAFTFFVGGFIPRRVIRRISLVPRQSARVSVDKADLAVRVNTYGWFGLYPRRGSLFEVPLSSVRAATEFNDSNKFINLVIVGRPFIFYVERAQAELIFLEYFEHLRPKD